jgi:urease accessory protein
VPTEAPISTSPTTEPAARQLGLLRLCQLVSPALPVGAFHFSQGLEYAVDRGWVRDEAAAREWIGGLAANAVARLDLPVLHRLHRAWCDRDAAAAVRWSRRLLAARDTAELRAEDRHLGGALARLLAQLGIAEAGDWVGTQDASFAALFALAAWRWDIGPGDAACGYLWAWCENQVLAAVKLVPLGQTAGQRLLDGIILHIPGLAAASARVGDEQIGVATPMQGIASARHEGQYSRLFRS